MALTNNCIHGIEPAYCALCKPGAHGEPVTREPKKKGNRVKTRLVTFTTWNQTPEKSTPVTVNPAEVSDVQDYCGSIEPGSLITLKNKKTYLVAGVHADIIAKLNGGTD
jgi:hypothetical protein